MRKLKSFQQSWKREKRLKDKRSVTLLELLIALSLLAVVLTTIGVQAPRLIEKTRFSEGVKHVVSKLSLAQEVMLNLQTDVTLAFEPCEEGVEMILTTEPHVSKAVGKQINHRSKIKGVTHIEVETAPLTFDATLGKIPEGKIVLFSKHQKETLFLKGFPSRIKRGEYALPKKEATYPQEFLSAF